MGVLGYGDPNVKMEKRVENGNVLRNLKDMRMNVNVSLGALMDNIWVLAPEIRVFGFGKVTSRCMRD